MFGKLADYLYVAFENRNGEIPREVQHIKTNRKKNESWICFLPEGILKLSYMGDRIFSEKNCDIYIIPKTAIQPNPKSTKELLEKITEIAVNDYSKKQEDVNVLGISLGNAPAYKFANSFFVNRFVSIVPGSFLSECIWESIATRKIAKGSGKTLDDYRDALDDFSPIRNLNNLKAGRIEVHLGVSDKMIPYQRGRELVDEMRNAGLNPLTTIYPFSGHCETIFYFARNFAI